MHFAHRHIHEYESITRASRVTGISIPTIRLAYYAGRVRAVQDGKRLKINVDDVRALGKAAEPARRVRFVEILRGQHGRDL